MAKLRIYFSASSEKIEVNYTLKSTVRSAISTTLAEEGFPFDAEVSVTFCDNEYIHRLNKKYRDVDRHTDVLSFPMYDGEFSAEECRFGATLGDIVISLERAREQAVEIGHGFLREVAFLAIHSTLHLLGYDHERSETDEQIQCEKQRKIIGELLLS